MAMRKERQRRYASPLLMAEDIENYMHGRPLMAGPETRSYRVKKFIWRHRMPVTFAIAALVMIAVGVSIYIHDIRAAERRTLAALADARQERDEASRQEQIAKTVNMFLSDMLSNADPKQGNKTTVVAAIADLIDRVDKGALKDQPLVEASIRDTIGNVQHHFPITMKPRKISDRGWTSQGIASAGSS